ncbi:MAG: DNA repair protein RadC, partial [Planctomycetota bacterium]|nr:DNA repair protein RadC [Planctomycetota bacterium]
CGELAPKADSMRFLVRYGLLDAGRDRPSLLKDYHALLTRLSRASGEAPGIVAAWVELFAAGAYGVLHSGICAPEPRCGICPLRETCRYLAAGGKDVRVFGESLARELRRSAARRPVDLRASELLAFILAGESGGAADIARAEAALKACNGVRGLFAAGPDVLRELGLGSAAVARVQALAELCRAWAGETAARGGVFTSGQDFYDAFYLKLRDLKQEVFVVATLDQKNRLLGEEQVSAGSLTETLIHPREVFARAIAERAAAVAVVHNHPSGDPAPSLADKAITRRLDSVAKLVGIRLLDHVIVGDGRFFSFVERGLLGG